MLDNPELGRLLNRVGGVMIRVGKADDLRLQQIAGEIRGTQRHQRLTQHLAAARGGQTCSRR
jgi:hypothetical protein